MHASEAVQTEKTYPLAFQVGDKYTVRLTNHYILNMTLAVDEQSYLTLNLRGNAGNFLA
jgi:hypothetical protein